MKKLIAIGVLMMAGIAAYAQGSVNFANIIISGGERIVDAPIYEPNGTTLATGPAYMAQLYAGANAGSLAPVGAPAPFLTGGGAGYFSGGARTIEAVAPGADAVIQVRACERRTGQRGKRRASLPPAGSVKAQSSPWELVEMDLRRGCRSRFWDWMAST
jgi:hypothetical protein